MLPSYLSHASAIEDKNTFIVDVNAEIASAMLAHNYPGNEKRRNEDKQRDMADQMLQGWFVDNGDSIILSNNGLLMDGQTRLGAVMLADQERPGFSRPFRVVTGVDDGVFATIDIGRTRTPAQILAMDGNAGDKSLSFLGAALRIVYLYDRRRLADIDNLSAFPKSIIPDLLNHYDGLLTSMEKQMRFHMFLAGQHFFPARVAIASHYLLSKKSESDADFFFDRLYDGANLTSTSPIHRLRERIGTRPKNNKIPILTCINEVILAWNAVQENRPMSAMRNPPQGQYLKIL